MVGAKLRTCQRLLLSSAENDPTLLTYEPWQSAMESCARMIKENSRRFLAIKTQPPS